MSGQSNPQVHNIAIIMVDTLHFLFMHLADAFIQSHLQCIQAILCVVVSMCCQPFVLLTQCSTTEPQEKILEHLIDFK